MPLFLFVGHKFSKTKLNESGNRPNNIVTICNQKSIDIFINLWYSVYIKDKEDMKVFKGRNDWDALWDSDKRSMLNTMVKNMAADLDAGYDYFGHSITKQREMIEQYKRQYEMELMSFVDMDEKTVQKWCYYDMKRRGAIE